MIKKLYLFIFILVIISSVDAGAYSSNGNALGSAYSSNINLADKLGGHNPDFFMPLNNSVFGNFSFNGDCLSGGVEIRDDGTICANKLEVFNITSVNVTQENITVTNDIIVQGNSTANWFNGLFNWTTISNFLSFNGHTLTFDDNLLISTIDNKILENNESVNNNIISRIFWINDTSEDNLINSSGTNIKTKNITFTTIINSSLNQGYEEHISRTVTIWL